METVSHFWRKLSVGMVGGGNSMLAPACVVSPYIIPYVVYVLADGCVRCCGTPAAIAGDCDKTLRPFLVPSKYGLRIGSRAGGVNNIYYSQQASITRYYAHAHFCIYVITTVYALMELIKRIYINIHTILYIYIYTCGYNSI